MGDCDSFQFNMLCFMAQIPAKLSRISFLFELQIYPNEKMHGKLSVSLSAYFVTTLRPLPPENGKNDPCITSMSILSISRSVGNQFLQISPPYASPER